MSQEIRLDGIPIYNHEDSLISTIRTFEYRSSNCEPFVPAQFHCGSAVTLAPSLRRDDYLTKQMDDLPALTVLDPVMEETQRRD